MERPVYVLPSLCAMESVPPGVTVSPLQFLLPPVLASTVQKPLPKYHYSSATCSPHPSSQGGEVVLSMLAYLCGASTSLPRFFF